MAKSKRVTPEEAKANAEAIVKLWEVGQDSLNHLQSLLHKHPHALRYRHRERTYAAEAKRLGTNIDKSAKMRRIAQEYTREEIDGLCSLVREHRSRFSATHLLALLRVKERSQRDRLMRQAVRGSWTSARLERAAQAVGGQRRKAVGRKPYVPSDPVERLLALDAVAEKLCRWTNETLTSLPESLQPLVERATDAARRVQTAIKRELKQMDADSDRRKSRS